MMAADAYTERLMRNLKVDCDGGCGRLVGVGEHNCPDCAELVRLFAAKMESDRRKVKAFPAQPRTDVGTVPHRRGDPCGLDDNRITLRERAALLAMVLGFVFTAAWCGWLGPLVVGAFHFIAARLAGLQ